MKWEDIKDSSDYAEALTLIASLIAAVVALKKAENEQANEKPEEQQSPSLPEVDGHLKVEDAPMVPVSFRSKQSFMKLNVHVVVIGLCFVAVIQLAIILFIAYRIL